MKGCGLNEPLLCVINVNVGLRQAVGRKFAGASRSSLAIHFGGERTVAGLCRLAGRFGRMVVGGA